MKNLNVALLQTHLHWQDIPANLQMLTNKLGEIKQPIDLIVLPEMFSTGFSMQPAQFAESMDATAMQWLKQTAALKNCVITGSLMLYEGDGNERKYYNRLVWMNADGSYQTYDKKHLFSLSDEPKIYTAGRTRLIQNLHGWKIRPLVCYDLRFPVWSRNAIDQNRNADFDILIYVANWPERRVLAWRTLLQARAIENQCYVVGVNRIGRESEAINYTGYSTTIDPLGNILYQKADEADIAIVELNYEEMVKARRQFPFLKDADSFELK